jgi:NADH-quinone oxidoreductase subunit N
MPVGMMTALVGLVGLGLGLAEPRRPQARRACLAVALATVIAAWLWLLWAWPGQPSEELGGGGLRADGFALFVQAVVLLGTAFALLFGIHAGDRWTPGSSGLLLMAAAGACLLAMAIDLIAILTGLVAAMLPLLGLAAVHPGPHGREAALKGLLATCLGVGLLGLGTALLASQTGTTLLAGLAEALAGLGWIGARPLLVAGLALVLAGLAVFIAAVPCHMVFPDAVEGSSEAGGLLWTGGLLVAALAALGRIALTGFQDSVLSGPGYLAWTEVLHGAGLVTILAANALALVQRRLKRLLACLASGQVGLALVTLAAAGVLGSRNPEELDQALGGWLAFLAVHALTWVCLFVAVGAVAPEDGSDPRLGQLEGLVHRRPWLAAAIGLALLCMSGLPLTAGFFVRLYLLETMVAAGWIGSAVAVALSLGLVLVMGLGLVGAMALRRPRDGVEVRSSPALTAVAWLSSLIILGLGFLPGGLMDLATQAAASLLGR